MRSFNKQSRRRGAVSGMTGILMVTAILVVVNLITIKHDVTKDVTRNQRFTLADQTLQILDSLEHPVEALSFVRETDGAWEQTTDLLAQFQRASDLFSSRAVDLNKEPLLAEKYEVTSYQTIVLIQDGVFRKVNEPTEHALTNTLIRLTRHEKQKTIYFSRGNGELDLESMESDGLGLLNMTLNNANYITESINLLTVKTIPEDCAVLAIVGPVNDPPDETMTVIADYLNRGGRLFMALEPGSAESFKNLILSAGIKVGSNIIIDPAGYQNVYQPIVEEWEKHPITDDFDFGLVLHVASSIETTGDGATGWRSQSLGKTSEKTWLETDIESIQEKTPEFNPETDQTGKFGIAAVSEQIPSKMSPDQPAGRMAVTGDADFIGNIFFQTFAAHEPFIMNTFHWLADEKDLIAIPPKQTLSQLMLLQSGQLIIAFIVPVILVPMIIALIGVVRIFTRRRRA